MLYWVRVLRRSAKEAAKDVRIDTWANAVIAVLAQALISAAIWFALGAAMPNGTLLTRVFVTAAPFITFPVAFFVRLITVPSDMAKEDAAGIEVEREELVKAEMRIVAIQAQLDERRCTISIQPIKCIPGPGGYESWRKEIKNDGPAVADAVQMTLTEISPSPKFDPHLADSCPQKVFHWARTFKEIRNILVGESELFEPINIHQNGLGAVAIGGIDTAQCRQINMEIGEEWTLHYRVSAKNTEPAEFTLVMRRNDDGLVVVNEIH
jgi:hypothetical protein